MSKPRASRSRAATNKPARRSQAATSKPARRSRTATNKRSRRPTSEPVLGPTGFKNVDLEIGAPTLEALAPIVRVLDTTMTQLFHGRLEHLGEYRAHYEINCGPADMHETLGHLADAIEALEPTARAAWDAAATRDFNIGVELERGVKTIEFALDPDIVRRITDLGGRIAVTAYQEVAIPVATLDTTSFQEALDRAKPRRAKPPAAKPRRAKPPAAKPRRTKSRRR